MEVKNKNKHWTRLYKLLGWLYLLKFNYRNKFNKMPIKLEVLFDELYHSKNEEDVDKVIQKYIDTFNKVSNWRPLGGHENNFGVIENQQASPIAALIEKITNSIDAILMKQAYLNKVDPKSSHSPKSMLDAVTAFFPNSKNWDLSVERKRQAEELQIIADGYYKERGKNTSLTIYDNGEGQHPEDFERTFLSLLRGNKNEIPFVQGKYNMGGTGAIVFCGKKRYQLIASKKHTNDGNFGFTLVRKHPMSKIEEKTKKNTWYEYLVINDKIASFSINELRLDLHKRTFKTGSLIKLYSYQLPAGARSVISRDLNQSINEFLFQPALPILMVDKKERYPKDENLQRDLFGLKKRLESSKNKYIEDSFSEKYNDSKIGEMAIMGYVFNTKIGDKTVKDSREAIRREFFKNNMSVIFSMNGQVHGFYRSEFISRSLKMSLLKKHLLVHVDCTNMKMSFRNELFMASRDRLKKGDEANLLREKLSKILKKSKLDKINKKRKQGISLDSKNSGELLKNLAKNLPKNSDLFSLLGKTFELDDADSEKIKPRPKQKNKGKKGDEVFNPKRYPSALKLKTKGKKDENGITVIKLPLGGEKTIQFSTDVEDDYFDRTEDNGALTITLLGQGFQSNETEGGNDVGGKTKPNDLINIRRTSPDKGTIKIMLEPTETVNVGDKIPLKVTLDGASSGENFDQIFFVEVIEKQPEAKKKPEEEKSDKLGLPDYKLVFEKEKEEELSWEVFENTIGQSMDYNTVMHPLIDGEQDKLECIFINMDSNVLKNYKSKIRNISSEQKDLSHKRYITAVYFHTLFLYTITLKRGYQFSRTKGGEEEPMEIAEYLKDLFQSYYSEFLLNFGMEDLMNSLEE